MTQIMRIAIEQREAFSRDIAKNLNQLTQTAQTAKEGGAEILILPEMSMTGYKIGRASVEELAQPLDGQMVKAAQKIAKDLDIAITFGFPEQAPVSKLVYNSVVFIGADGQLMNSYRKVHLAGKIDRDMFQEVECDGDPVLSAFDYRGWKIGLLICYDVEFPETVRSLALKGAELVLTPTACMRPYDMVPEILVPARATENQLYVAYVNYCGFEEGLEYCGLSCVSGPDGRDLCRAQRDSALLFADLNKNNIKEARAAFNYLKDRRYPFHCQ